MMMMCEASSWATILSDYGGHAEGDDEPEVLPKFRSIKGYCVLLHFLAPVLYCCSSMVLV
jgi:hypothetical protein